MQAWLCVPRVLLKCGVAWTVARWLFVKSVCGCRQCLPGAVWVMHNHVASVVIDHHVAVPFATAMHQRSTGI